MIRSLFQPATKLLTSFAAAAALTLNSCSPPPSFDQSGNVVSLAPSPSLVQAGRSQFLQLKRQKRISHNSAYIAQTKRVANRLKKVIDLPGAQWEFVVFDDPTPNAFALPGGKVGIHTGLFPITKNDAGLAAVLGHEIAHITRNHAGQRRNRMMAVMAGGIIADQVARSRGATATERAKIGAAYAGISTVGVALPHSRRAELESDRIGTIYMAKAGYDPREAVNMWKRFGAYNNRKGRSMPEFLRTHPLDNTRIRALQQFMPVALQAYRNR